MVHLKTSLSPEQVEALNARLRAEVLDVKRQGSSWTFWTSRDTCHAALAIVPFGAESLGHGEVTNQTMDDDDISAISIALGDPPAQSLQFDNYCGSDNVGHRELGKLAASLASEYAGVVDVGAVAVSDSIRLPTKRFLLAPAAFARWCEHPDFYLEK